MIANVFGQSDPSPAVEAQLATAWQALCRREGHKPRPFKPDGRPAGQRGQKIAARRQKVAPLYQAGMRLEDIAKRLGASKKTVQEDVVALINAGTLERRNIVKVANLYDHERIRELRNEGLSPSQIRERLGCSVTTVRRALRA